MKMTATYHASVERIDRINLIIDLFKGDWGTPVCAVQSISNPTSECVLTTNGIIVVRGITTKKLLTMWVASIDQAVAIYKEATHQRYLPNGLYAQVLANQKLRKIYFSKGLDK